MPTKIVPEGKVSFICKQEEIHPAYHLYNVLSDSTGFQLIGAFRIVVLKQLLYMQIFFKDQSSFCFTDYKLLYFTQFESGIR